MWKEFKEFAIKGNAMDLAVGVIIGAAFNGIVNSLVKDIIMPPIGLITGGLDFSNKFLVLHPGKDGSTAFASLDAASKAGATTWNYGNFISLLINFLIVAVAVFVLVCVINRLRGAPKEEEPTSKECPACAMQIPIKANRCPHCTTQLTQTAAR